MSICTIGYLGSLSIGISTLAQLAPSPTTFEKYGINGLMVLAIVALWKNARDSEAAAQKRRDEREVREEARAREFIDAIKQVNATIETKYEKCGVNQYLLDQIRRIGK